MLPQLDTSYYLSQLFWLSFSFIGVYYISSKIIIPSMFSIASKRMNMINNNLSFIKESTEMINKINKEIDEKILNVNTQSNEMLSQVNNKISEFKKKKSLEMQQIINTNSFQINSEIDEEIVKIKSTLKSDASNSISLILNVANVKFNSEQNKINIINFMNNNFHSSIERLKYRN